ncbi:MAG: hypothetical protein ABJF52_09125, partial [Aurantibacter sp.]
MNFQKISLILIFFASALGYAQVKVGENPDTIHQSSIIELESDSKVLVLTRVDDIEMYAIRPLAGGMVYNTEQGCIFQYNGTTWNSLCSSGTTLNETTTVIIDNNDGSFSYTNEDNQAVVINKASIINDGNGNYTFTNNNGSPITFKGTDNQDATEVLLNTPIDVDGDGTAENDVQSAIAGLANLNTDDDITDVNFDGTNLTVEEGTTSFSANLSTLDDSAAITTLQADVDQNETDADTAIAAVQADVDQNETDADNAIAAVQADVDQNETDADNAIAANTAAITAHNTADQDISATNELSDLDLTGNILTLTNPATGTNEVDLAGFVSSDDQNLESATLSAANELGINIEG